MCSDVVRYVRLEPEAKQSADAFSAITECEAEIQALLKELQQAQETIHQSNASLQGLLGVASQSVITLQDSSSPEECLQAYATLGAILRALQDSDFITLGEGTEHLSPVFSAFDTLEQSVNTRTQTFEAYWNRHLSLDVVHTYHIDQKQTLSESQRELLKNRDATFLEISIPYTDDPSQTYPTPDEIRELIQKRCFNNETLIEKDIPNAASFGDHSAGIHRFTIVADYQTILSILYGLQGTNYQKDGASHPLCQPDVGLNTCINLFRAQRPQNQVQTSASPVSYAAPPQAESALPKPRHSLFGLREIVQQHGDEAQVLQDAVRSALAAETHTTFRQSLEAIESDVSCITPESSSNHASSYLNITDVLKTSGNNSSLTSGEQAVMTAFNALHDAVEAELYDPSRYFERHQRIGLVPITECPKNCRNALSKSQNILLSNNMPPNDRMLYVDIPYTPDPGSAPATLDAIVQKIEAVLPEGVQPYVEERPMEGRHGVSRMLLVAKATDLAAAVDAIGTLQYSKGNDVTAPLYDATTIDALKQELSPQQAPPRRAANGGIGY